MNEQKLEAAIAYFQDAIRESDEIIADCTPALQAELTEQRGHFVVALEAMRAPLPDNEALTERDTAMVCSVRTTNRGIGVTGEYDIDSDLICPVCGAVVGDAERNELNGPFCSDCGQRLSQPAEED